MIHQRNHFFNSIAWNLLISIIMMHIWSESISKMFLQVDITSSMDVRLTGWKTNFKFTVWVQSTQQLSKKKKKKKTESFKFEKNALQSCIKSAIMKLLCIMKSGRYVMPNYPSKILLRHSVFWWRVWLLMREKDLASQWLTQRGRD